MLIESVKRAEGAMTEVAFVCVNSIIERSLGGLIADYDTRWTLRESIGDGDRGCYFQGANGCGDLMPRDVVAGS